MDRDMEKYDSFEQQMKLKFPKMFSQPFGGFAVGEGWWHIIETLCANIQGHIDSTNRHRQYLLENNPGSRHIPDVVPQVIVAQIKEKFGGLRFYYDGGDSYVNGLVNMAESWAGCSCEVCGAPGQSTNTGWIKTLCTAHKKE